MTTAPPRLGEVLGDYRLEKIVAGGIGCLFAARHVQDQSRVAVKVISDGLPSETKQKKRIAKEAQIAREIEHPNIVHMIAYLELESPVRIAYVLEPPAGPTLTQVLRRGALSPRQVNNLALQLADVLVAVHRHGLTHRDLRPDQLVVVAPLESDFAQVPSVKVLDFGVLKADELVRGAGREGPTSFLYGAPEQLERARVSTPASDVFAFGEILFEMLTGERLFAGDAPAELLRAKQAPVVDLSRRELPEREAWARLIQRCVSPEPSHRPNAENLVESLRAIQTVLPAPTPAPRRSLMPRRMAAVVEREGRRGPKLAAAAAVAIVGAVALGWLLWPPPETARVARDESSAPPVEQLVALTNTAAPSLAPRSAPATRSGPVQLEVTPASALIFDAQTGAPLGAMIEVPVRGRREVEIRARGYVTRRVMVFDGNEALRVTLIPR